MANNEMNYQEHNKYIAKVNQKKVLLCCYKIEIE